MRLPFEAQALAEIEDAAARYEQKREGYGALFVAVVPPMPVRGHLGPFRRRARAPSLRSPTVERSASGGWRRGR